MHINFIQFKYIFLWYLYETGLTVYGRSHRTLASASLLGGPMWEGDPTGYCCEPVDLGSCLSVHQVLKKYIKIKIFLSPGFL